MQRQLTDSFGRMVTYMRLSVTPECNLRCIYCRSSQTHGNESAALMTTDEIVRVVRLAAGLGITKIRLTGGEPTLRPDLGTIVCRIVDETAISDVSLTTNGILLTRFGPELRAAGIQRVNLSLDSLNTDTYQAINGGNLKDALAGCHAALSLFDEVRINMVVLRNMNFEEVTNFVSFGNDMKVTVRFLELMATRNVDDKQQFVSTEEVQQRLRKRYFLEPLEQMSGTAVANWYHVNGGPQVVGFISPVSQPFCSTCNRIRITASGDIMPCLHSSAAISLLPLLRNGSTDSDLESCFRQAISAKPAMHLLSVQGTSSTECDMMLTGG